MQAIEPRTPTAQNAGETASSSPNAVSSRSQNIATDSQRKKIQDREMKTDELSPATINSSGFFRRFRKKKMTNTRHWKACEVFFLALTTAVTISMNAVPTILYFTVVSKPTITNINVRDQHNVNVV